VTTSLLDSDATVRACVLTLAGEPFAIDVTQVREVAIFDGWTVVPLAPSHLVGVANLRGDVVPIADPRAVLGLPARRGGRKLTTLIVEADGVEVALVIDGEVSLEAFAGIEALDESNPQPHADWAFGFLLQGERLVPLLDPTRLLRALRVDRPEDGAGETGEVGAPAAGAR
jgi:chemotaxis signal transduction protein